MTNLSLRCDARICNEIIPADRMHRLCITSPPYWMLRDYREPGQIGMEPEPEWFIQNLAAAFAAVWYRVTDDGSLVIIIGDSYFGGGSSTAYGNDHANFTAKSTMAGTHPGGSVRPVKPQKHKRFRVGEQIGIPWMLADALRDVGWMVRQVSIWHKPNPMPGPFRKRLTSSHEYILHLTKSMDYYCERSALDNGQRIMRDFIECEELPTSITASVSRGGHSKSAGYPEALVKPFIEALSAPGDLVLDPFHGSGTTGRACESLGRSWTGCDISASPTPPQIVS